MIEPQEPVEPDETEYCAWQDQQTANGNTLNPVVRYKSERSCADCIHYPVDERCEQCDEDEHDGFEPNSR